MEKQEYMAKACRDLSSYLNNEISKEDFIVSYKINASKSLDYAHIVADLLNANIDTVCRQENSEKQLGVSQDEYLNLMNLRTKTATEQKIVDAVYDVAYTRIPNNDKDRFGKPLSYDRKRNQGVAAERALTALSTINEYGFAMNALREAYFFPRTNIPNTGLTSNRALLDTIKDDAKVCASENRYMLNQVQAGR